MTRILVVEDEGSVRANIVDLLEAEGYETQEASDGEEALHFLWENPPDLILCDVRMPRLDGFTLLSRLSQDPRLRSIPFIFLTARVEREDQRLGMNLGADDYITKPFTRKDLLTAVQRRLEKHRHIGEIAVFHHLHSVEQIIKDLPDDLMVPAQRLFLFARSLMSQAEVPSHIGQIREWGRDLNKLSHQMLISIRHFVLLNQIIQLEKDLDQIHNLRMLMTFSAHEVMQDIAVSYAALWERASDLVVDLQPCSLAIGEVWLVNLLECGLNWAFSRSHHGVEIHLMGKCLLNDLYEIRILYEPLHPLMEEPASGLSPEQKPVALHLIERISELHEGSFTYIPGPKQSELRVALKCQKGERGLFYV